MKNEIIKMMVPAVGESINEVTISSWLKKDGDVVEFELAEDPKGEVVLFALNEKGYEELAKNYASIRTALAEQFRDRDDIGPESEYFQYLYKSEKASKESDDESDWDGKTD